MLREPSYLKRSNWKEHRHHPQHSCHVSSLMSTSSTPPTLVSESGEIRVPYSPSSSVAIASSLEENFSLKLERQDFISLWMESTLLSSAG